MQIESVLGEYLDANVYIVKKNNQCLIIDSGADIEKVKDEIGGLKVQGILLTHGHYDHSAYCNQYAEEFKAPIYASEHVIETISDPVALYSEDGSIIEDTKHFVLLKGDEKFKVGDFEVSSYYCPGHSICCQCYIIDGVMFAGDVLFEKGIGRTDLKNSNKAQMLESLKKIEKLEFKNVYSGHGNSSTYENQMKNLAVFKRFLSR